MRLDDRRHRPSTCASRSCRPHRRAECRAPRHARGPRRGAGADCPAANGKARTWSREDHPMKPRVPGGPSIDRYIKTGLGICVFGFGSFTLWAGLAPLTSAAMAPGIVKASSHVKTVQHFDGGIISEILVRDGDHVTENQLLMRLQGTEFSADYDALDQRIIDLETQEARLAAERDKAPSISLPKRIAARSADPKVVAAFAGQRRIFADQAATLAKQTDVWRSRIEQYRSQIAATEQQNRTLSRQIDLLSVELKDAASLLAKGYERKSRVLEIERREAGLRGDLAGTSAASPRSRSRPARRRSGSRALYRPMPRRLRRNCVRCRASAPRSRKRCAKQQAGLPAPRSVPRRRALSSICLPSLPDRWSPRAAPCSTLSRARMSSSSKPVFSRSISMSCIAAS